MVLSNLLFDTDATVAHERHDHQVVRKSASVESQTEYSRGTTKKE